MSSSSMYSSYFPSPALQHIPSPIPSVMVNVYSPYWTHSTTTSSWLAP
eukprot:CAMPEP_0196139558 /NCGR_PEP_ID=MMETSP0910-20130528/6794_1 /TAXON_ID=49265 /ORGANISM="Thalassiosira rotula, Strain GSO102" /LENGTH=47 /DNA_ID= /DNA_START= /DNA_END= /DNA_ORIENTATION=